MDLVSLRQRFASLEAAGAAEPRVREARQALKAAAAGSLEEAYLQFELGRALVEQQAWSEALVPLRRAAALRPDLAQLHYFIGCCHSRLEHWPEALPPLQRACGLDPRNAASWREQARVARALDQLPLALACSRRAQELDPGLEQLAAERWELEVEVALSESSVDQAASAMAEALRQPAPLGDVLLERWLALAASWILIGELREAMPLLEALTTECASVEACSQPVPSRPALVLLALLHLLREKAPPPPLGAALRERLWLPSTSSEQRIWRASIHPVLCLLAGRGEAPFTAAQSQVLASVLALLPPAAANAALLRDLGMRDPAIRWRLAEADAIANPVPLLQLSPGATEASPFLPAIAAASRARHDLPALGEALAAALDPAAAHLRRRPADPRPRRWLDALLWHLNHLMMERPARLLMHPGRLPQALALRHQALTRLVHATECLLRLDGAEPAPAPVGPRRHWLLLANQDLPQCFLYRVEQKRQQLERLGCAVRIVLREQLVGWSWGEDLLWADAVVVCRMPAIYPVLRFLEAARRAGLPLWFDIDDLLFDGAHAPPVFSSFGGSISASTHRSLCLDGMLFQQAMERADGVILSTTVLAQRWRELRGAAQGQEQSITVLPNLAPPELLAQIKPPLLRSSPLRLVCASGSKAHKLAWQEELAPALARILAEHPQVRLDLLGTMGLPDVLAPHADRIRCLPYSGYARYVQELGRADLGLVALEDGLFTDAKSAIRWMEFSLRGVASVLTPTATYREILQEGRHALFARGVAQWHAAIEKLLRHPEQRQALAERAQQHALALFSPERADPIWRPLLDPPAPRLWGRRKLLVVHVFFAPQSEGGATRVVQDQVRGLIETAGSRYDITVLCVDQDPWQALPKRKRSAQEQDEAEEEGEESREGLPADGQELEPEDLSPIPLDVHGWHGARVVRLALPRRRWSMHHSANVERFCRWWFERERFDLIHAHCLQLITAAPLKVAAELHIPYLITLHDAWWISPHQFLTTPLGSSVDPEDPAGLPSSPNGIDPRVREEALLRRQELDPILASAAGCLAVSESFADLHRRAGVPKVSCLENDWTPMGQVQRPARSPGSPLRICHVGGMACHKGYAVLRAAVLRQPLRARFTIIDGRLRPGESYDTTWGDTPVRFQAPVPMDRMAAFYAEQDVLVAPSIWPESYGLVTREALSAGLWVIASDIGALAEPIEEGVNGNRLPPGDAAALAAALQRLCAQPPRPWPEPRQEPPRQRAIEELLSMYERLSP